MTRMAAMSIYDKKNSQNVLLQNRTAIDLQTWYAALGTRVLPDSFK